MEKLDTVYEKHENALKGLKETANRNQDGTKALETKMDDIY